MSAIMTHEQREKRICEIAERRKKGEYPDVLAAEYGLTYGYICTATKPYGPFKRRPVPPNKYWKEERNQKILAACEEGHTLRQIAEQFGISAARVGAIVYAARRRRQQAQAS